MTPRPLRKNKAVIRRVSTTRSEDDVTQFRLKRVLLTVCFDRRSDDRKGRNTVISVICIPLPSLFNCDFCATTPRAATNKYFDVDLRGELEFSFVVDSDMQQCATDCRSVV